jgi:hypothetical protein
MMIDNVEIAAALLRAISARRGPDVHVEQVDFVDVEQECGIPDLMAYCYLTGGDCEPVLLQGLRGLSCSRHLEIEAMVCRGVAAAAVRMH